MAIHFKVILCQPQLPENIGATARSLGNFGLTDLCLVRPEVPFDHPKAVAMAVTTGKDILSHTTIYQSLEDAIKDCHITFATTSSGREQIKKVFTPLAARHHLEIIAKNEESLTVGLVFGCERTGLSNADINLCHHIMTLPTQGSLNLAQAVLIVVYEFMRETNPKSVLVTGATTLAPQKEIDHFYAFLEEKLDITNFWREPRKKRLMWQNIRNVFQRAHLTVQEVRTLMGLVRALYERRSGEKS